MTSAGFDAKFLGTTAGIPVLTESGADDAVELDGSTTIDYTHFSLALSKSRKFAIWVAWNIDGGEMKALSRSNIPFIKDPRLPAQFQTGDELYRDNRLDRGHLARRADLCWGPKAEAQKANRDSFFFTNITPQMDDFNQSTKEGLWGRLEDAVLADVDVDNLKVSVYGGPVFNADDRVFRSVAIPREFYKAIAFVVNGELRCSAFLLTQNLVLAEALDLDEFRVFQVSVAELEKRVNFTFPAELHAADTAAVQLLDESERKPLGSLSDIRW
ncbi:DNA/RNA non-specific endonuclease [Lentzea sp. NEAU-D13]|uniref:DNA/RNA non-specific endonuclease n=1 Tax=Lentzea alba TaxID=2714351 RepID=A0A7C9RPJ5_9PSEU|nr:DNA/RNA non-specific endonuclease [Lentzea alba]NGY57362.1 DNA/RNA non-specific endonuclease [Lentzea alba]